MNIIVIAHYLLYSLLIILITHYSLLIIAERAGCRTAEPQGALNGEPVGNVALLCVNNKYKFTLEIVFVANLRLEH